MSIRTGNVHRADIGRWTSLSIWLHWLIVALLIARFVEGEWMAELFETAPGAVPDTTTLTLG